VRPRVKILSLMACTVLVLLGFLAWGAVSAKRRAQAMSCGSNLKSVALGSRLYSNDHNDTLAKSLIELSNEVVTPKVLICPADGERKSANAWKKLNAIPWSQLTTNDITYEWMARGEPDTNANRIILLCPIHGFTARADGSVRDQRKDRRRTQSILRAITPVPRSARVCGRGILR